MNAHIEPDESYAEVDGFALDIVVAPADGVLEPGTEARIASAILAAREAAEPVRGLVTVLVDDDARIRDLNKRWRGIDKPTNVLSFPYPDDQPGPARHIGDIAISYETTAREAAAENKPFAHHVAHLAVHGFLHLLGHDHETDDEADAMEQLERTILARIDVPDPYIARDAKADS